MGTLDQMFVIVIIIFSAVIHEVMHGLAADWLGDKTARYAGRLTLNPIPHIDPFGSVILPVLLTLSNAPIAFAGQLSNLVIAVLFSIVVRLGVLSPDINAVLFLVIVVNVMLFLFNLIPIPPLDGSKVIESLLPSSLQYRYAGWRMQMEANPFVGMGIVMIFILILGGAFGAFVYSVARVLAGL
jgi:Zn-dependent protease